MIKEAESCQSDSASFFFEIQKLTAVIAGSIVFCRLFGFTRAHAQSQSGFDVS